MTTSGAVPRTGTAERVRPCLAGRRKGRAGDALQKPQERPNKRFEGLGVDVCRKPPLTSPRSKNRGSVGLALVLSLSRSSLAKQGSLSAAPALAGSRCPCRSLPLLNLFGLSGCSGASGSHLAQLSKPCPLFSYCPACLSAGGFGWGGGLLRWSAGELFTGKRRQLQVDRFY